ncbi:MAG: formate dehydrogenase beta subunit [Ferrimicrobium sp.]
MLGQTTIFVPRDAASRSVGADAVAQEILEYAEAAGKDVRIVRNGSRGLFWLEPLVEIDTAEGRIAYGPVSTADVAELIAVGMLEGAPHPLRLGVTEEIPFLSRQTRRTFARVGVIDPVSVDDYLAHGGLKALTMALEMDQLRIVEEVTASGLRGRGGAGFPTGIKWKTVLEAEADMKFICCNADEGDSGTYADRMLMEGDPFLLIEAMTIAGVAVGAEEGYLYIRSEYPDAIATMSVAIEAAYDNGWLGRSVLGSSHSFDLQIRVGAGAYICGEETAMLESLEGRRGVARAKPPLPAIAGLFAKPTVVNNVLSLAAVPGILTEGAAAYQALGVGRSRGTQVFQLAGNVKYAGIVEVGFGLTLGELVESYGGGSASGRPIRAVQVGGPLGAYLPVSKFDTAMDYEAFGALGAMVGHGGVVVFDDTTDMGKQARFAMEFCAEESCGKCTPCRIGAVRGVEVIDRILRGEDVESNLTLLDDLCETMVDGSLCAMGGLTPTPVRSVFKYFPEDIDHLVMAKE